MLLATLIKRYPLKPLVFTQKEGIGLVSDVHWLCFHFSRFGYSTFGKSFYHNKSRQG